MYLYHKNAESKVFVITPQYANIQMSQKTVNKGLFGVSNSPTKCKDCDVLQIVDNGQSGGSENPTVLQHHGVHKMTDMNDKSTNCCVVKP